MYSSTPHEILLHLREIPRDIPFFRNMGLLQNITQLDITTFLENTSVPAHWINDLGLNFVENDNPSNQPIYFDSWKDKIGIWFGALRDQEKRDTALSMLETAFNRSIRLTGRLQEYHIKPLVRSLSDEVQAPITYSLLMSTIQDQYDVDYLSRTLVLSLDDDLGYGEKVLLELGQSEETVMPLTQLIINREGQAQKRAINILKNFLEEVAIPSTAKHYIGVLNNSESQPIEDLIIESGYDPVVVDRMFHILVKEHRESHSKIYRIFDEYTTNPVVQEDLCRRWIDNYFFAEQDANVNHLLPVFNTLEYSMFASVFFEEYNRLTESERLDELYEHLIANRPEIEPIIQHRFEAHYV